MITYQIENFTDNLEAVAALTYEHWKEIAGYRDKIALNPDWDKYREMDSIGIVLLMTARDNGAMVGYSIFMIFPLLHYRDHVAASNDVIYLRPQYRGIPGYKLVKFCHESLVKIGGVSRITWHIKPVNDWSRILIKLGYKVEEQMLGICLI